MFREEFTEAEWETIMFAPLWAFTVVAGADGKVEEKEMAVLVNELIEAGLYKDEFVREVLSAIAGSLESTMIAYTQDSRNTLIGLMETANLLDKKKLPAGAADSLKRAIFGICIQTAQATGKGKKKKVSEEAKKALAIVAAALRVPLA